ncbi:hypothetical protein [Longimicrobium sp.]|uniref:hypothetical protein n=1 Tax=Longimicrobium sp. TaxID=2029185 RepID=UPI002E342D3B|nr:hypothetical protein [Longimicrobium sp.]HEX6038049.1 hypothetical protein [Longimicrobium sp.]
MGEAARRKQQGFDGRKLGEDVVAALNADAGGPAWELVRGGQQPDHFLVLGAEDESVRAVVITNREAQETPHRIVVQRLYRRGEPWLHTLIFDPSEEYRADLYTQVARRAVGVVHGASDEGIDRVQHEIIHSSWPELQENVDRVSMEPGQLPQAEPAQESAAEPESQA